MVKKWRGYPKIKNNFIAYKKSLEKRKLIINKKTGKVEKMGWFKTFFKIFLVEVFKKAIDLITNSKDKGTMKKDKSNE